MYVMQIKLGSGRGGGCLCLSLRRLMFWCMFLEAWLTGFGGLVEGL